MSRSWMRHLLLVCVSVFFFFKQKTAYEMRISDWSSDVCSSDLHRLAKRIPARFVVAKLIDRGARRRQQYRLARRRSLMRARDRDIKRAAFVHRHVRPPNLGAARPRLADRLSACAATVHGSSSAESREGKEGVSQVRSPWS